MERNESFGSTQVVATFAKSVYSWMAIGLGWTGVVAYFVFRMGLHDQILPLCGILAFALFGVGMAFSYGVRSWSFPALSGLFLAYATIEGLFFGSVLPVYASQYGGDLIWIAFGSAAVVYSSAVIYGISTNADLTGIRQILSVALMALIGMTLFFLIGSLFMDLSAMYLMIAYLGLIIFVGLTVTDAQQIRIMSRQLSMHSEEAHKLSLVAALRMYINLIMIFWYLLRILASSRRN